jgi:hypothetical protein
VFYVITFAATSTAASASASASTSRNSEASFSAGQSRKTAGDDQSKEPKGNTIDNPHRASWANGPSQHRNFIVVYGVANDKPNKAKHS